MKTDLITAHLRSALPDLLAIYIFGSQVDGNAGPASDLDLAILVAGKADPLKLWLLSGELADLAGIPVDLLDLRAASTVMQHQILSKGQRLWAQGIDVGLFESYVLSEKTALDTARGPLLKTIQEEGTVYGR
jgi:predicted nucleotidyltransferase